MKVVDIKLENGLTVKGRILVKHEDDVTFYSQNRIARNLYMNGELKTVTLVEFCIIPEFGDDIPDAVIKEHLWRKEITRPLF
jgi:hypothetical protein